jgi:hypothetical protein
MMTLHWHTGATTEIGRQFNSELLELGEPIYQAENIIWGREAVK